MRRKYGIYLGAATLILGEILTRLFFPSLPSPRKDGRATDHPYIRSEWVPGFEEAGAIDFKINDFGFRSAAMKTSEKPEGTSRIFFLGGSTTEEILLPEEKTFPFLVQEKLRDKFPGRRFECVNGGNSGYFAADVLSLLIYKVLYYQPDTVLVMLGINDLRAGTLPGFDPVKRPHFRKAIDRPEAPHRLSSCLSSLLKRSRFLTLLKRRIWDRISPSAGRRFRTRLEEYDLHRRERRSRPFLDPLESKSLGDFVKSLEEMVFVARGHGIRLIFMTEASIYQEDVPPRIEEALWMGYMKESGINLSTAFLYRGMKSFNDATRLLAVKYGLELIDLDAAVPKDLDHFYDDCHFTAKGAARAAEVIFAVLSENPSPGVPSQGG
jgi:lysophospholipase L1-like esterase